MALLSSVVRVKGFCDILKECHRAVRTAGKVTPDELGRGLLLGRASYEADDIVGQQR